MKALILFGLGLCAALTLYMAYYVPPVGLVIAAGLYVYWLYHA